MRIEALAIKEFVPFRAQICKFGSPGGQGTDVHILVGENGTGKTRLLSLLMAACGNDKELQDRAGSKVQVMVFGREGNQEIAWVHEHCAGRTQFPTDQTFNDYLASGQLGIVQSLGPHLFDPAKGRAAMAFRSVAAIREEQFKPLAAVKWGEPGDILLFCRNDSTTLGQAILNMKIRAGIYLAGNPSQRADRTNGMIERLEKTLGTITGRPFVFLVEQDGENVYLKVSWGGVRIRLHQLPDGLRAIIGCLVGCVARLDLLLPDKEAPLDQSIILFLDEPETHLHPAWQRKVVPAIKSLLPHAQLFIATHSPFVVSSVNEGWIYVLKAKDDGTVQINEPKACSKGDTYIDAVEDALGLKEWYDPETEAMLSTFRKLRDAALETFAEADKAAMREQAKEIAKRSLSLEMMMGQELAQFDRKEKSVGQ